MCIRDSDRAGRQIIRCPCRRFDGAGIDRCRWRFHNSALRILRDVVDHLRNIRHQSEVCHRAIAGHRHREGEGWQSGGRQVHNFFLDDQAANIGGVRPLRRLVDIDGGAALIIRSKHRQSRHGLGCVGGLGSLGRIRSPHFQIIAQRLGILRAVIAGAQRGGVGACLLYTSRCV